MALIYFVSLGCDKNRVDSEKMLGCLSEKGFDITDDEDLADVAVVNTCGFILDAKEESIETIIGLGKKKEENLKALIVTGCLAERYKDEILEELPEIDAVLGTNSYDELPKVVGKVLGGTSHLKSFKPLSGFPEAKKRQVLPPYHYGYLKIAEGCDKRCTYCAIPDMRGPYRSVPLEDLVKEATSLSENGVKELILVAQETTVYGEDIYGSKKLPLLLRELSGIEDIEWIRLLYCYPEEITDELLFEMRDNEKVLHYLDLPIQHSEDNILKKMGRRTNRKGLLDKIRRIRQIVPDISLRTTLISGFPGESEDDHEKLLDFVRKVKFDRLGVFPYSREEGTKAFDFEGQIEGDVKKRRSDEIMVLQQEISFEKNKSLKGSVFPVMVEGYIPEDRIYVGRSFRDAPDIDGYVFFESVRGLMSGRIVKVKVTGYDGYDLIGEMI